MNFAVGIEVFAGLSVVMLYMLSGLKDILCDDKIAHIFCTNIHPKISIFL
jgi:hypothetical protein